MIVGPEAALAALRPLLERAHKLGTDEPIADRTRAAYARGWAAFETWCTERGLPTQPAESVLLVYLAHLDGEGARLNTVQRAYYAILHHWRAGGREWIPPPVVVRFWKNLRRERGTSVRRVAALTYDRLEHVLPELPAGLRGKRDYALLTLGLTGAFRRSELVALNVEDLTFEDAGVDVRVVRSKTDQEGEGAAVWIPLATNEALCASRALRRWLDAAKLTEGAVFRNVTPYGVCKGRLDTGTVARIVKRYVGAAGLDAATFSGHSLRAGFLTSAAEAGRSLDETMKHTRHKDPKVAMGYIRHADRKRKSAVKGLA